MSLYCFKKKSGPIAPAGKVSALVHLFDTFYCPLAFFQPFLHIIHDSWRKRDTPSLRMPQTSSFCSQTLVSACR